MACSCTRPLLVQQVGGRRYRAPPSSMPQESNLHRPPSFSPLCPLPNLNTPETMADEQPPVLPANAEDRKAASALANLDDSRDDAGAASSSSASAAPVDKAALDKATKGSSVVSASSSAAAYKNVKVDAADVALLVEELELPKLKATELLKRHEGDAVKAMRAYVAAA